MFDEFVRQQTGGSRLEELLPKGIPEGTSNADYIFNDERIIVELKTLTKNHGDRDSVIRHVDAGLNKLGLPLQRRADWLAGKRPLPKKVKRYVDQRVQRSLEQVVRKANSQIRETSKLLEQEFNGILVVANLGEILFGPLELLRYLAGHALRRSRLAIDGIVLVTPGVSYSTGGNPPKHYAAPVYREGKEQLRDFVEPFIDAWLKFEAESFGVESKLEIVREFDEESKNARPA